MSETLGVSVIIPTYNRSEMINHAVNTALAAIDPSVDEIIVVDDGSSDGTIANLAAYGGTVRCLNRPHRGAGSARNAGIAAATRPLVAFLDSDDEWFPDKIRLQRALMQACPEVLFCFSDFGRRSLSLGEERRCLATWHNDARGWDEILGPGIPYSQIGELPAWREDFLVHRGDMSLQEMQRPYMFTSTLVARRMQAGDNLRFAEDVETFEDWECFGRLSCAGMAAYLDCETAWQWGHRKHRLSGASALQQSSAELAILPRVWGSSPQFISRYSRHYHDRICAQTEKKLKALAMLGRIDEARQLLHSHPHAPQSLRLLLSLPDPLARAAIATRQTARRSVGLVKRKLAGHAR